MLYNSNLHSHKKKDFLHNQFHIHQLNLHLYHHHSRYRSHHTVRWGLDRIDRKHLFALHQFPHRSRCLHNHKLLPQVAELYTLRRRRYKAAGLYRIQFHTPTHLRLQFHRNHRLYYCRFQVVDLSRHIPFYHQYTASLPGRIRLRTIRPQYLHQWCRRSHRPSCYTLHRRVPPQYKISEHQYKLFRQDRILLHTLPTRYLHLLVRHSHYQHHHKFREGRVYNHLKQIFPFHSEFL